MSSRSSISFTVVRTLARNSSGDRSAAVGAISARTLAWTTALDCNHASSEEEVRSVLRRLGSIFGRWPSRTAVGARTAIARRGGRCGRLGDPVCGGQLL